MSETPQHPPTPPRPSRRDVSMSDTPPPELPEKPKSTTGRWLGAGAALVAVALVGTIAVKTLNGGGGDGHLKTVTVGTTEASDPYWSQLVKVGKQKYGLDIKPVNFSDYTQANPALAQGQTDLNQFQHLEFLANYDVSAHADLTPIGSTYIVPLALYSKKHTSLAQFHQGGKVAIPNDPTNQARALLLLQSAGLLKLKGGGNAVSTPADVEADSSKVGVTPVDAAQTAATLPSVEGAVVNNNFAADANLDPSKALLKDDPKASSSQAYINVVAARKQDADNPTYAQFVKAYHDPSVTALRVAQTKGTSVTVTKPASELRSVLSTLEAQIKAKQ